MRYRLTSTLFALAFAALWPRAGQAAEVDPGGEVFIDPIDVGGGFLAPLTQLSPRPQTQVHLVPVEFHLSQVNLIGVTDERFLQYQIRVGGSVAFARRFELGVELLPVHVLAARYYVPLLDEEQKDTDVSFGNFSAHFLGNILAFHGDYPQYFSGAFRVTFPTAGDVRLDMDDDGTRDWEAMVDSWMLEPQFLYGITLANMVTLSTRQGLAIILSPEEREDDPYANHDPFLGEPQVHWAMNFAVGVAPNRWFALMADFTALFCMNETRFWDPETSRGLHRNTHPIFMYLGFGGKVFPIPALGIEAAFRFGLTDETQYTVGLMQFALKVSYEWDVSIGGVTVIKEPTTSSGGPGGEDVM